METETWKDLTDFEGLYQVSDMGRIRSLDYQGKRRKEPLILSLTENGTGYLKIMICKDKKKVTRYIHRLVAHEFVGNPNGYDCVDHINGIRDDNRAINLRFCTHRENLSFDNVRRKRKKSSKYVGVHFDKESSKWVAIIGFNGGYKKLGRFKNEYDAHLAYQEKLKTLQ